MGGAPKANLLEGLHLLSGLGVSAESPRRSWGEAAGLMKVRESLLPSL